MKFLPETKVWRKTLFILFGLFLLSRILTLSAFPIFNDEAIYLQYAQRIHDDWGKNKFISMHGEFTDWKPPLMYWMAAPFIDWGNDPLLAGRAVALLASVAGFLGFYLFAKELFGEREGVITALLYLLCPPVLFHNNQFTAETFLISTAALFYWALLKAMQRDKTRWWIWGVSAVLLGIALLLFKQSGFLLLAISALLPLARLRTREKGSDSFRYHWEATILNVSLVVAVIVTSKLVADALLPSAFDATRDHFNSRWVLSATEVLRFPADIWRANLGVVADYIASYYTWPIALFFCGSIWIAFRTRDFPALTLAGMCLAGAIAVTFLLRGFNEYVLNTAVIVVLLPPLGRLALLLYEPAHSRKEGLVRLAVIYVALIVLGHWAGRDILMGLAPGKYIERSTPWAIANYLTGWPTGFGVKETVAILEQEKRPGVVFVDAQWGNPGTALEVYGKKRFPQLRMVPVSREFLDPAATRKLKEAALNLAPVRFAIYSADSSADRPQWQTNLQAEMCEARREIRVHPSQAPIVLCSF